MDRNTPDVVLPNLSTPDVNYSKLLWSSERLMWIYLTYFAKTEFGQYFAYFRNFSTFITALYERYHDIYVNHVREVQIMRPAWSVSHKGGLRTWKSAVGDFKKDF